MKNIFYLLLSILLLACNLETKTPKKAKSIKVLLKDKFDAQAKIENKFRNYYDSLLLAMENQNYPRAIQYVDSALIIKPNDAQTYNTQGVAYIYSGSVNDPINNAKAIKSFDKAIELDDTQHTFYNNRGWAYQIMDKYKMASKDYDQAMYLQPYTVEYHGNVLRVLYLTKQYNEALQMCDSIINQFPNDGYAYHIRGEIKRDHLHQYLEGNEDKEMAQELEWSQGIQLYYDDE